MKRGRGRPRHVPTDELKATVRSLAAIGTPHDRIAAAIEIGESTLEKYYTEVMKHAEVKANASVALSLYEQAVGRPAQYDAQGRLLRKELPRNTAAGIWWTKTRMGWKDTSPSGDKDDTLRIIATGGLPKLEPPPALLKIEPPTEES